MKKLIVLSFVAALSVAGCSKKKADTTPTNAEKTNATEEKMAPEAGKTEGDKPANPCAGGAANPCAGGEKK